MREILTQTVKDLAFECIEIDMVHAGGKDRGDDKGGWGAGQRHGVKIRRRLSIVVRIEMKKILAQAAEYLLFQSIKVDSMRAGKRGQGLGARGWRNSGVRHQRYDGRWRLMAACGRGELSFGLFYAASYRRTSTTVEESRNRR